MIKEQTSFERGSALVYILIAIALLAALTATLMNSSNEQSSSQSTLNTVTELSSQANLIQSTIQECILNFPAGDDALVGTDNIPYPINPSSTYLSLPLPATDLVSALRCPGNPGDSNDHADMFGGTSGKFMPPPPNLFEPWLYYNGPDGVFFYTSTDYPDAFIQTALSKLDDQYSECEADVIDATGGVQSLTLAGPPTCPNGSTCFRVWIIAQAGNVYNGDTDGDEAACP